MVYPDLGRVFLTMFFYIMSCMRSIASCLLSDALAISLFLIVVALVLTSVWLYVHVMNLPFDYCQIIFRNVVHYLASWFTPLHRLSSPAANAIEDIAVLVKGEPNVDSSMDGFPPLSDSSLLVSDSSENHNTPPQSLRLKPCESAACVAISTSAFSSDPKDQSHVSIRL